MNEEHVHTARLTRALDALTVGATEAERRQHHADRIVSGGDMAQHVRVELQGKVGNEPIYLEQRVSFPYPFLMKVAKLQTEGMTDRPHFNSGVELKSDSHVSIDPQVIGWIEDDSQFIRGAVIRCAVWSPDAPRLTRYSATVHLTFFGFAAPAEDDTEG